MKSNQEMIVSRLVTAPLAFPVMVLAHNHDYDAVGSTATAA